MLTKLIPYVLVGALAAQILAGGAQRLSRVGGAWRRLPDAPLDRGSIATLASDNRIYAGNSTEFVSYRIDSGTWTFLPHTRSEFSALVAADNAVYAFGDCSTPITEYAAMKYSIRARRWSAVAHSPSYHNGGVGVLGRDDFIYLIGGDLCTQLTGPAADYYNPSTGRWHALALLPVSLYLPGVATTSDGRVYVLGGVAEDAHGRISVSRAVWVLDPRLNRWRAAAPMPAACAGLAAVTGPDGRIYTIGGSPNAINFQAQGGYTPHPVGTVAVYSPTTNSWSAAPGLAVPRWGLSAVLAPGGTIYAIGGVTANPRQTRAVVETYHVPPTAASH